jgi:hypothetical protein
MPCLQSVLAMRCCMRDATSSLKIWPAPPVFKAWVQDFARFVVTQGPLSNLILHEVVTLRPTAMNSGMMVGKCFWNQSTRFFLATVVLRKLLRNICVWSWRDAFGFLSLIDEEKACQLGRISQNLFLMQSNNVSLEW